MIRRIALTAMILAVSAAAFSAEEEGGSVFMWKVKGDGATVHLLGSIHALKENAYPLPPVIEEAFAASSVVAFEVDMDEMTAAAFQMLAAGSLEGTETLEELVGAEMWARFEAKMAGTGLPPAMFQSMKPWMAAVTLMGTELQAAGYNEAAGVDSYFTTRAKDTGKTRIALETIDFQIGIFAALTPEQSLEFFEYTLDDMETMVPMLEEMHLRWRAGDAAFLESVLVDEFKGHPELYDSLVLNRNRAWMPAVEKLLAGSEDAMVIVGALHLVGEDGLVEMLRAKGYTVTQK